MSFAKVHFMEIMSFTCICPGNTILATYARGILQPLSLAKLMQRFIRCVEFVIVVYRQHPGQYDYFRNYDDLEVCCTKLIYLGIYLLSNMYASNLVVILPLPISSGALHHGFTLAPSWALSPLGKWS